MSDPKPPTNEATPVFLAAQEAEEQIKRKLAGRLPERDLSYSQIILNLISPAIERESADLAQRLAEAEQRAKSAEAFASKVERGELRFSERVNEEMAAIAALPTGKTTDESISQAVARVISERDAALATVEQLRAERDYAIAGGKALADVVREASKAHKREIEELLEADNGTYDELVAFAQFCLVPDRPMGSNAEYLSEIRDRAKKFTTKEVAIKTAQS